MHESSERRAKSKSNNNFNSSYTFPQFNPQFNPQYNMPEIELYNGFYMQQPLQQNSFYSCSNEKS